MAQIAARGGGTPFGSSVVTVAELLSRNPVSQTAIPVGVLLRREGRIPNARDVDDVDAGSALTARVHARRVSARRGAVFAGGLIAAGSVVGVAVLNSIASAPPAVDEQALPASGPDQFPAQAALPAVAAPLATVGQGANASPLDAGVSAPSSWMNVAFPDTVHKPAAAPVSGKGDVRGGSATADRTEAGSTGTRSTTPGSTTQGSTAGSAAPAAQTGANTGAVAAPAGDSAPAKSVTVQQAATGDSVTGRLGSTIASLGGGTPLAPVTSAFGGAITGLGEALGAVVHGGTAK